MSLRGNEEIRAFMDKLTATTNVSKYIDLPMIAVMGDTSSGKSSLLSSLSAVELPSASELTTRCPIMLQMKRAEKKQAIINVQWKNIPQGKLEKDVEFSTVNIDEASWDGLPDAIARAQKHIIDLSGKEVARDIVRVQVQGPNCEDLTVVDLPGIVRSRGKNESENIVGDIKALIDDYLSNKRCVILAIVPANVDFHNSQIMADALDVDPDTKRTIPVITKPDLIDSGAENDVKELLLGRKTRDFQMGFHMVKGRGQADLDRKVTIEEGLRNEEFFFSTTQPWRDVEDQEVFGTTKLRKKLGDLQLGMIRESLPSIIAELKEKDEEASNELLRLGNIPNSDSEKRVFFRQLVDNIMNRMREMLTGKGHAGTKALIQDQQTFASKLHEECENFRESIRKSKFSNISSKKVGVDVLVTVNNGEIIKGTIVGCTTDGIFVDYIDRKKGVNRSEFVATFGAESHSFGSIRRRKEGEVWVNAKGCFCISGGDGTHDILKPVPADRVRHDPKWILPRIKRNRTDDLPIFVNQEVFRVIVVHFIDIEWQEPSEKLVSHTKELLVEALEKALTATEELRHYPGLYRFLHHRLTEVISNIEDIAKEQVAHFIDKERLPYTQDHYLQEILAKLKFEHVFKQLHVALGLSGHLKTEMSRESIQTVLEAIAKQNQEKSIDEHMAEDMQHALDAYGKVAMKRFIDGIPMQCWNMFRTFPQDAEAVFLDFGDDDLRRHVVPRDDVRRKIHALEAQEKELKAGLVILESLY
ncbi:dynamin central region-domain containing protein [Nitzschia inconspicua]|uniref:Dynamin central region-domain containing protein n=1 Tax=Nitzschia inconspicua TaxID=303405 RepID=A0A9K3Q168_9STRA|nr:dynamin central region-domain containing protein [Nitzschia inconspicua]